MARPQPCIHVSRVPRRGPTAGGPRPLLVVGRGRPPRRDVRVLVVLGILGLGPPRRAVPPRRGAGGARPMSTPITLLGLGHLAGVLGRLHAAALVAPEAPHRWCVLQGQPRRGGVARCGARRLLTRCRGAVRPLACDWAAFSPPFTALPADSARRLCRSSLREIILLATRCGKRRGPRGGRGAREGSVRGLGPVALTALGASRGAPRGFPRATSAPVL